MTDRDQFDTLHCFLDEENGQGFENVKKLSIPVRIDKRPKKADLETMTLALSVLLEERERRPELVRMLEKYPCLLAEYLTLPLREMMELELFRRIHDDYFYATSVSGDCISNVTKRGCDGAAMIARKYRWAEQLNKMFAFYLEHHRETHPFNNNYLRENPELRKRFGTLGPTLVKNSYQNGIEVKDIVAVIASSKPDIRNYYQEPGYRSNAIPLPKRRR